VGSHPLLNGRVGRKGGLVSRSSVTCKGLSAIALVGATFVAVLLVASPPLAGGAIRSLREVPHVTTSCNGTLPTGTVVGLAATGDDGGYWIANNLGSVVACGDAPVFAGLTPAPSRPIVGIAATPDGGGYYLVASNGSVFTFGDAIFHGPTTALSLNRPIVGMAVDAATGGYWLVASDGGIFSFDAPYDGSTGAMTLNKPVVGMASSNGGSGYWLVASDGGIFAFNAPYSGSTGAMHLNKPVVGMSADLATGGYWLVASDGGIFAFNAPYLGSTGNIALAKPIFGMESNESGTGYRFVASDGGVFDFGTSDFFGSAVAPVPVPVPVAPQPAGPECQASAVPANDGYAGDYNVNVTSNQPNRTATASDATDKYSYPTNGSGSATVFLWDTSPGELISVTVGAASCSTRAQA
jgi:hypothetical protein